MTDFDPDAYLQDSQAFDPDAYLNTSENAAPQQQDKSYLSDYWNRVKTASKNLYNLFAEHPGTSTIQSIEGLPAAIVSPVAHTIGSGAAMAENAISHIPGAQYLGYDPNTTYAKTNAAYQEAIGKEVDPRSDVGKAYIDVLGSVFKPAGDVLTLPGKAVTGAANALGVSKENAQSAGEQTNAVVNNALLGYGSRDKEAPAQQAAPTQKQVNLDRADELGLVKPPATSNPNAVNNLAEAYAGKVSTAQAMSVKNREVFNNVARKELNLPDGAPLTPEVLDTVRQAQQPAYEAIKQVPDIQFGASYNKELDSLAATSSKIQAALPNYKSTASQQIGDLINSLKPENGVMDGETAVELSKSLRAEASSYYNTANRTGDPTARALARAYDGASTAVENAIEDHLTKIGQPELATNWDNARRTIAKSYTIQNALDGAGNIDASKLGKQLIKRKPLSPDLEAIADFANTYPKASKPTNESMPGMSPLDVYGSVGTAVATGSPIPLIIGPGRMMTRKVLTSPLGQWMGKPSGQYDLSPYTKPASLSAILGTNARQQDKSKQ